MLSIRKKSKILLFIKGLCFFLSNRHFHDLEEITGISLGSETQESLTLGSQISRVKSEFSRVKMFISRVQCYIVC